MEYFFTSSNLTFLIIPLIFVFLITQISKSTKKKLPPGPWKLPIIGNLLHMAFSGSLPHHALSALAKKYGPIFHLQLGEISAVVISSARLAKEALKVNDLAVANRPQFLATKTIFYDATDLVFSPYGDYWRQMHKLCVMEILSAKKVRSFQSIRDEEAARVIDSIRSSSEPIDLGKMIYALQNTIACRATFGSKCKDPDALVNLILEIVSYSGGFDVPNLFPSLKFLDILSGSRSKVSKTHQKLDGFLDEIIEAHLDKPAGASRTDDEDLVDVVLRLKETGDLEIPITTGNIKAITLDMFAAGTESVSGTIVWAMAEMIRQPRVLKKAQAELRQVLKGKKVIEETDFQNFNYLKMVIKETLRLRNPLPLLISRQSAEQFKIDGYIIPAKTNIIVNYRTIARDPEFWQDAESFIPERFENSSIDLKGTNFEFIPFGAGKRMCPGMAFGLAGVEHTLAHLLYHLDWKLPNGMKREDVDMSETFGGAVGRKNPLYLVATPYSHHHG